MFSAPGCIGARKGRAALERRNPASLVSFVLHVCCETIRARCLAGEAYLRPAQLLLLRFVVLCWSGSLTAGVGRPRKSWKRPVASAAHLQSPSGAAPHRGRLQGVGCARALTQIPSLRGTCLHHRPASGRLPRRSDCVRGPRA